MSRFVTLSVARNQAGQWDKGLFKTVSPETAFALRI